MARSRRTFPEAPGHATPAQPAPAQRPAASPQPPAASPHPAASPQAAASPHPAASPQPPAASPHPAASPQPPAASPHPALTRRTFLGAGAAGLGALLAACSAPSATPAPEPSAQDPEPSVDVHAFDQLALDMTQWSWDKDHDVYYQLGVPYCLTPGAVAYEKLSIYVPGAYFTAQKNGSLYTCAVDPQGSQGAFTPATAPVVMPVNCPEYAPQVPQSSYSYEGLKPFLSAGCVYVYAGCRGRANGYDSEASGDGFFAGGFPWNVADLKAAVRFVRYNADALPCDPRGLTVAGLGSGGNLAALLGVSGDADPFRPFLTTLGAAEWDATGSPVSDAVDAVALWCPQVGLPTMDGAYEWLYGQYANTDTRAEGLWTRGLSQALAQTWPVWLNQLGLKDDEGEALALEQTTGALYADGTFYQALCQQVQEAMRAFFEETTFPVSLGGQTIHASFPGGDVDLQTTTQLEAEPTMSPAQTYQKAEDYVTALNGDAPWLVYSAASSRVRVESLGGYARTCAAPTLPCTAFDGVECKTPQNQCFGVRDKTTLHFSRQVWDVLNDNLFTLSELKGWNSAYVGQWGVDLQVKDAQNLSVEARAQMCDQFSYLVADAPLDGRGTLAPRWRVNVGLLQPEAPFSATYAFAQALKAAGATEVAFQGVWAPAKTLCERTGEPEDNLMAWLAQSPQESSSTDGGGEEPSGSSDDLTLQAALRNSAAGSVDESGESGASMTQASQ